jgi:hypothetical protein
MHDNKSSVLDKKVTDFFDEMKESNVHEFMKMWFSAAYRNGQGTVGDMMVRVRDLRRRNNWRLFNNSKPIAHGDFFPNFSNKKYLRKRLDEINETAARHSCFMYDRQLGCMLFEHMEKNHLFDNIYNGTPYQYTF